MRMTRVIWFILCIALFPTLSRGQQSPIETYQTLLTQLKGGDTTIDFQALRYAYSETPQYNPYRNISQLRNAMFAAGNRSEYAKALEAAEAILELNYTNIDAHMVSYVSYRETGNAAKAEFHRAVLSGLCDSIAKSGNGKSPETAYVVIAVDEEYAFLREKGFKVTSQALIAAGGPTIGGPTDALATAELGTSKKAPTVYFNIAKPAAWFARSMGSTTTGTP